MEDRNKKALVTMFSSEDFAAFETRTEKWRYLEVTRAVVGCLAAVVALFAMLHLAQAAECLENSRQVSFADGSARMRSFVCRSDDINQQPTIRVEFDRLSEIATGSLLKEIPYPEYVKTLGYPAGAPKHPPILMKDSVQAVAEELYDKFGTKQRLSTCYRTEIQTPKSGKDYDQHKGICGKQRIAWYLTFPDSENSTWRTIFSSPTAKHISDRMDWPVGFNFYYGECKGRNVVSCTTLWKGVSKRDEATYRKASLADKGFEDNKNFKLLEYLMSSKWYDDFAIVTLSDNECSGFDFGIALRQLIVDVALIENLTDHPITLDGFIGTLSRSTALRLDQHESGQSGENLSVPKITLKPGEKAALPLMLTFAPPDGFDAAFSDLEESQEVYRKIRNSEEGHVFRSAEDNGKVITKRRESFGAPSRPTMPDYVFGPSLTLESIVVDGKKIELKSTTHNFLRLTAGDGYGSCPYLYAWDPKGRTWIWYGKVIHGASARQKEMTQEVVLTSFSLKFRLVEEEPEVSYIRKVQLKLALQDGAEVILDPTDGGDAERGNNYTKIPAGAGFSVEFRLPPTVASKDVKRSKLLISGYYLHDPTLQLSKE